MNRAHLFHRDRNKRRPFLGLLFCLALAPEIELFVSGHLHKHNSVSRDLFGNLRVFQNILFKFKYQIEVPLNQLLLRSLMATPLLRIARGKPTSFA